MNRLAFRLPFSGSMALRAFGLALLASTVAMPGAAQSSTNPPPATGLIAWLPFLVGTILIWAVFYLGFYPWARRYFDGDATKSLFLPLCANAFLTWWHLTLFYGNLQLWSTWSWRSEAMIVLSFLLLLWLGFSVFRAKTRA